MSKQKVSYMIEAAMELKISRLAKAKKISQGELVRQLLEIGFENIDYEKMTDKFERLQKEHEIFSVSVHARFEKMSGELKLIDQRLTKFNFNTIRTSILLEKFSELMISDTAKFIDMKNRVQMEHTKIKNMATGES